MEKNVSSSSLGDFLRARRARLTPENVGLPSYGRRRTPGLRREEVAQLAHIGTSWYTFLEQGKEVRPSEQVMDSLADALRLSDDERRHLHMLARSAELKEEVSDHEVSVGVERTVLALEPNPALLLGRSWDLLIWNKAAEIVFRLPAFSKDIRQRPNWLRRFLTDSSARTNNSDWESKAQAMIAQFRSDYARYPRDAKLKELVEEFYKTSELFRAYWPRYDVQNVTDCHKRWMHPSIGVMEFEQVTLEQPNHPEQKLMIYTASRSTAKRLNSLLRKGYPHEG